ncbi:Inactive histone-lysine N-methyltransferase 2E [Bienertia sinuspersici]
MAKWEFELIKFGISYHLRTSIKAQTVANFLAERSHQETLDGEKKEPLMISYLAKVKELTVKLRGFEVELIPQNQNTQADALSMLASSTLLE